MRRHALALPWLMLVLLTVPAWAQKWEYLGTQAQGKMYLDLNSVKHTGSMVSYWVKRVFDKPQTSPAKEFQYSEQHVHHEVDCAKRTVTFTGMRFYNKGKQVASTDKMKQAHRPIEASGFITKEADRLCPALAQKPAGKAKGH